MSEIKQSDIFETVDKYLNPQKNQPKLVNLLQMLGNSPSAGRITPAQGVPLGVPDPADLANKYDSAMDQNVKPEPIDPNLFNFQGRA